MLGPQEEYNDVATLVREKARKNGDRIALRFLHGDLTYRQLDEQSERLAAGLADQGVTPGARLACLVSNRPEFVVTWFGTLKASAVFVPLNTALRGELLEYELRDCQPSLAIVEEVFRGAFQGAPTGSLPTWWIPSKEVPSRDAIVDHAFGDLLESRRPSLEFVPKPSSPASILYTSGTTGRPKGVVLPHRRLISTPREIGLRARLAEDSILFTALPLFHCNAQEKTALVALLNDLSAAFADRFHPTTFWQTAHRFQATHTALLTTMITILFNQAASPEDRSHGVHIAPASGTPRSIWREFEERFGIDIIESYGMTECGCTTLMNPPDRVRLGSVGTPLGFVEAEVFDDHDRPVPPGEPGELVVRPKEAFTMFLEYFRKPEETVGAWRNLWFHTGDLVQLDQDGYFYFIDRKRDVIRRRGENIAPYDVEVILNRHPSVLESVVVGVPSEVGEEDVKAFVQLRLGQAIAAEELFAFLAERLPKFMVPRYLEYIDEIPKTANQKAQRFLLRGHLTGKEIDLRKLQSFSR